MEYINQLGLRLPRLTLGTVQLGLAYGIANKAGQPGAKESFALLGEAEKLGVNCFDTAAAYGTSEKVLGEYFASRPAPARTVVSKFKLDSKRDYSPGELEQAVETQLEQSLLQLGCQKIPVYLLHQASDLAKYGEKLVALLEKLVARGLIGLAGVSVYTAADLDKMARYELFQVCQLPLSILDQRLIQSGHLASLHEKGIIVFARSVFLQGLLFLPPADLPKNLGQAAPFLAKLQELASQEKISLAQLAVSFVRDLPGVSSLVIGAETKAQVRENVQLCCGPGLTDASRQAALACCQAVPEQLLNPALW